MRSGPPGPHVAVNHVPGNGFRSTVRAWPPGPYVAVNHVSGYGFRSSVRAGPYVAANHVPGNAFCSSLWTVPHVKVDNVLQIGSLHAANRTIISETQQYSSVEWTKICHYIKYGRKYEKSPDGKWIRRMKCEGNKSSGLIDLNIFIQLYPNILHLQVLSQQKSK